MISPRFTIYTKCQKAAFRILDTIQIIFGLSITVFVVCAMLVTQSHVDIWTIIMGIAAIISLVDIIIRKTFNKQSFSYKLVLKFCKSNVTLFPPTPMQIEMCSWINTRIRDGKGILIYGKANTGKTSSVFMFLSQNTKDIDLLQNINWAESIIYIDCKNSKNDILDFFSIQGEYLNEKVYENSLIIVDNLEVMGETFLENLLHIINSSLGVFILLADASHLDNDIYNTLEIKCMRNNCTLSICNYNLDEFKKIYEKLTDNEKKVLLVMYYLSLSLTLIQIKDIRDILGVDYSIFRFRIVINSLLRKGLIKYFPFDHSYILMANRGHMDKYQSAILETKQNLEAIHKVLQSSDKFPESAWISLIHLPYEQIKQICPNKREQLFTDALNSGNYVTLCKTLMEELMYSPNKEDVFLYEAGTLYFYNSQQEKAFEKYNMLISKEVSDIKKNRIILRIIESTHGDVTSATKKNMDYYLKKLENDGDEYSLYAKYWTLHIETERGFFLLDKYEKLLKEIIEYRDKTKDKEIYLELVKRCYTDIIRSYHILKRTLPSSLIFDFEAFLNRNYPKNIIMHKYYYSLYIEANTLHYIDLLDNILEGKRCQDTYDKALAWYNCAIASGYENIKSVSACELKCIDLKLFINDNVSEFSEYETKIKKFLSNAEINRVSVHVAYCKTLLAKLYIIRNLYDNEYRKLSNRKSKDSGIKACLREAKKIYKDYQNEYGVLRIDILELLYHIATISDKNELEYAVKKMADILEEHQEYQREMDIVQFLKKIIEKDESFGMLVFSIIKAYPIIMQ